MQEDGIEHRPCGLGQIGHEFAEFAIKIAKKQQNRADRFRRLKPLRHQWWKLLRQHRCVRAGDFKGKLRVKWFWLIVCFFLVVGSGKCFLCGLSIHRGQLLRPEIEGQLVDRAIEAEGHLVVLIVHPGAGVGPDIEGLVERQCERDCLGDLQRADLATVHLQHAGAALPEAGAVIREVEHDRVLARRERRVAVVCPASSQEHEQVVREHRLALEEVQSVPSPVSLTGNCPW